MPWTAFFLGAAATLVGPRVLKRVVHSAVKGAMAVRNEVVKAAVEAQKEVETKRSVTTGPTGQA